MSSVILTGDTSGTLTVSAPLVAGSNTVTLPAATGTISLLTQATSVSASGTSVDFTGIPSWAKRITVMFQGVSTSSTSPVQIQLGDAGGIENTGYSGTLTRFGTSTLGSTSLSAGVQTDSGTASAAASTRNGIVVFNNLTSNVWAFSGNIGLGNTDFLGAVGGSKSLSDVLTQVRITTVNGTDTFDAGSINVMWEG